MASRIFIGDAAFCAAVGFLAGILAADLGWDIASVIAWTLFMAAVILVLNIFPITINFRVIGMVGGIFFAALLFGAFYYHFYLARVAAEMKLPHGNAGAFSAIVSDEPKTSDTSALLTVDLEKPYTGTVTVFAPFDSDFRYGDELKIDGSVSPAKKVWQGPAVFPRRITAIGHHEAFWIREALINLKRAILDRYNAMLPVDEATLLGGITFGAKTSFKPELKMAMATSGTTHLVAISGYNITIVIIAAEQILGGFLARRAKFSATVALIILFILMTGLQSSAIRAGIMGFIALVAKESGSAFSMRNAVTFTAAIMAGIQPTVLVHDAGFQLTFMSLLGIVCMLGPVKKLVRYEDPGFLDWKENAVTTFSAQLGVMPILIGVFGQFSLTAIFANILVLGTVPATMLFGFVLAGLGFVSAYVAFFLAKVAWFLLAYQLAIIRLFAALAVPLPIPFNSALVFIVYYSAFGLIAYTYRDIP